MHLFLKNCKHLYVCYNMIVLLEYDDCFNRGISCDCGSDSLTVFPILILIHILIILILIHILIILILIHVLVLILSVVTTHHKQNELKYTIFVESLSARHLCI